MVFASLPRLNPSQLRHAFKTALAAVGAYVLTLVLGLPQGYWAVISVIIVMQANLGGSLRAGWMRVIGTAVGATMGVLCVLAFGQGFVSLGVSVGLTILVCAYFTHLHESFRLAGLTACIVIFLSHQEPSVVLFGLTRVLEISLGVAVAIAVSLFVMPSRAGFQLGKGVVQALYDEADLYSILLACRKAEDCAPEDETKARKTLEATRARNRALLAEAKREPAGFSSAGHIVVSLYNFTERIAEHLLSMELAVHSEELEPLHERVAQTMDLLAQTTITAMTALALAIARRRDPGSLDGLRNAVAAAEQALGEVRRKRVLASLDLDAVMRFFSYYYNLREVALELCDMAERATLLVED